MTAGLPGAGIGGVFYLLAALFSPAWHIMRALGGKSVGPWAPVRRHFLLAGAILSAMWITGWLIGVIVTSMPVRGQLLSGPVDSTYTQLIGRRMALFTLGTLAAVLLFVEALRIARLARHRWRRRTGVEIPRRCSTPIAGAGVVPADDAA